MHNLEILLLWLEDNVSNGTDIEFTDGVDSAAMIPAVCAAVSLLDMPKAKRDAAPWGEYYHSTAAPDLEMNRAEAQVWNAARDFVLKNLKDGVAHSDQQVRRENFDDNNN